MLRVGFRSSGGGWTGAYHPDGNPAHGMVRDDRWYGPMVEMIMEIGQMIGFRINMTDAPTWVYESSGKSRWVDLNGYQSLHEYCTRELVPLRSFENPAAPHQ